MYHSFVSAAFPADETGTVDMDINQARSDVSAQGVDFDCPARGSPPRPRMLDAAVGKDHGSVPYGLIRQNDHAVLDAKRSH
jgi:hypothetical protein